MENPRKLKVLVIAEAANPEWTSVPLIGWSHTFALSKVCDVHLATQVRNQAAIERFGWTEGQHFTAINSETLARPFYKFEQWIRGGDSLGWTISTAAASLCYPYFEYLCWKHFKKALHAGEYDVVHRITPVSPTAPSYLASKLKHLGVPLVIGPLNGGVDWPPQFRDLQRKEKEWLSYVRNAYKLMPGYRALRRKASCIIAGSMATKAQLPQQYSDRVLYLPENAIDVSRFSLKNTSSYGLPLKAAFVGRLVPYKGADMAIEAMEELVKQKRMTFDVYGNGPEEARLKQLVSARGLQEGITIHGFVPNTQLQERLVKADLLVFPSIREFGGGVVLEAMALGVVPVIVDYAGPSELVTDNCGYKLPLSKRENLVESFKNTLNEICAAPEQLAEKRQACLNRVQDFYTWDKKVLQVLKIYEWVLGKGERPDFNEPFV